MIMKVPVAVLLHQLDGMFKAKSIYCPHLALSFGGSLKPLPHACFQPSS